MGRGWPNLLPIMKLLLPLPLLDLQLLARLALLGSARGGLQAAMLLLHAQTHRILLLLAHQLLLVQATRPRLLGALGRSGRPSREDRQENFFEGHRLPFTVHRSRF